MLKSFRINKRNALLVILVVVMAIVMVPAPASAHGTRYPWNHTHFEKYIYRAECLPDAFLASQYHAWPSPYFQVWDSLAGKWYYHMHQGDYGWDDKGHYVGQGANSFYWQCGGQ
jgi:hypothetical protein